MNPPYNGNLHLKILEHAIPFADKTINISPVRWLQDPLAKYKRNSDYKKYENTICKKIEYLKIISAKEATDLFGGESVVTFKINLGIYKCDNSHFNDTDRFFNTILDKIVNSEFCGIPYKQLKNSNGNFCLLNRILGNHSGITGFSNYMPLIKSVHTYGKYYINFHSEKNGLTVSNNKATNKRSVNGIVDDWTVVDFNTEDELINFYNSTNTKFFKYILCSILVSATVPLSYLPYMKDYTQPWNNKRFCEYFGITGYIDDEHAESNSEWETILNTVNKYEI